MYKKINGSKKIHIQGLDMYLPRYPQRSLISGFELSKTNQKFIRTKLPDEWSEKRAKEVKRQENNPNYVNDELEKFRVQEWNRRIYGHWFYNYGTPTYVTGLHYFYMNWWKCDFGYPEFRIPDLDLYHFLQYAIEDPFCMGINEITLRRDGKTARAGAFLYDAVSRTPNVYGGIQSKTDADAKKVFLKSVVLPWENLPDFFRPIFDYNSTQKKEIRFFPPGIKGKGALDRFNSQERGLESILDYKSSGLYAYDGEKLYRQIVDEAGKSEEVDVWERHEVLQPCFEEWGKDGFFGKMYCTTTVEDMNVVGGSYKRLTEKSNINERDGNGRTLSGLYTYFKESYKGFKYNKHGFPLQEEGKKFFLTRRKALSGDPGALSSYIRKHPFTIEEAFMIDGDYCIFNAMVLNEVNSILNLNKNITNRGDFIWADGVTDGKVIFIPNNQNGKFHISWIPDDQDTNKIIEITPRIIDGNQVKQFKPMNDEKFAIATDPVDHGQTVDESRKSNAAAYCFRKFDYLIDGSREEYEWETHNFVAEYISRPYDPEIYFEDMVKFCKFFGCQILVENQKQGVLGHFKRRGYGKFIMNRPENTFTTKGKSQDTPGIPANRQTIQQYIDKLLNFVHNHGHRLKFRRLVVDLLEFNPTKPRKHDPTVAAGFTLIASEKPMPKQIQTVGGLQYMQAFDNSGNRSVLIK